MKIIGLFGKANQGKTTTLKQVMERLEERGGEITEKIRVNDIPDWHVVIKYEGKKICIATGGDNPNAILKNCDFFDKHNPDVAVSAVRTKGNPRAELIKYAEKQNAQI